MAIEIDYSIIVEEIKSNQKRLDSCKQHRFPTWPPPEVLAFKFRHKVTCCNCGGEMDALQAASYTRGYVAAGGNGNDVIPDWSV